MLVATSSTQCHHLKEATYFFKIGRYVVDGEEVSTTFVISYVRRACY